MSRELSITVPDDVAARLDQEQDAEAFLIETARHRIRVEQLDALNRELGVSVSMEGLARAAARRQALEAEWTPQRWAEAREASRRAADALFSDSATGHASAA